MAFLGVATEQNWERREYASGAVGVGFWDDKEGFVNVAHDVRLDCVDTLLAVPDLIEALQLAERSLPDIRQRWTSIPVYASRDLGNLATTIRAALAKVRGAAPDARPERTVTDA